MTKFTREDFHRAGNQLREKLAKEGKTLQDHAREVLKDHEMTTLMDAVLVVSILVRDFGDEEENEAWGRICRWIDAKEEAAL